MYLPGRHESVEPDGYRFGFQGQELDNEIKGEGNSYNYTFRMHDPRFGRFFAVDPLAPKYPHNSPYAFSENRVLDGVELEGLEYATIVYRYYHGKKKPEFTIEWFDDNQHNKFGEKFGKSVGFRTERYDENGNITSTSATTYFKRNARAVYPLDYGFYYGPTQLKNVYLINNYIMPAVDAVDEAGRIHDKGYDNVGANADNATKSWATIEIDETFVKSNIEVVKLGRGGIDPFNGQKITGAQVSAAGRARDYFNLSKWNKIEAVSEWMVTNYPDKAKEASGFFNDNENRQRTNYELFRDIYMHKDSNGDWLRNEGMWKKVGDNDDEHWAPKTKKELKSK